MEDAEPIGANEYEAVGSKSLHEVKVVAPVAERAEEAAGGLHDEDVGVDIQCPAHCHCGLDGSTLETCRQVG